MQEPLRGRRPMTRGLLSERGVARRTGTGWTCRWLGSVRVTNSGGESWSGMQPESGYAETIMRTRRYLSDRTKNIGAGAAAYGCWLGSCGATDGTCRSSRAIEIVHVAGLTWIVEQGFTWPRVRSPPFRRLEAPCPGIRDAPAHRC